MVFESFVTSLLNRFLGAYVENLDASKMNFAIWSGNVVLNDLRLKASSLDEFNLSVKMKYGFLEKLALKIPWQNLYTEPVVAEIEGLYLLAVPNVGIKYNAEKEEKMAIDAKLAELMRIELAKKQAVTVPQEDTFAERMLSQVIKNLQVTIRNIHIRYEDCFSNVERRFAAGFTLHQLCFQTTDEDWKPCILKELKKIIYKVAMKKGISRKGYIPEEFYYILAPISIGAYLKLNTKPEADGTNFSVPKFFVAIEIDELTLNIHKYQYQGILEFLEAQEQFALNATYRKFRPYGISYRGHAKEWWKFAIDAIMETEVQRRARNWSWKHIKQHRELLKEYRAAWVEKLTNKNISVEKVAKIQLAEKELDLFNLNIARQAAEIDIRRRGLKLIEEQGGWVSWVKSFWYSDQKQEQQNDLTDITTQFEKAMTKEEKAKLYEAIGYQENQLPTIYPKEFVDIDIRFKLGCFTVVVLDTNEAGSRQGILRMCLQFVEASFKQRRSAGAFLLEGEVGVFKITGVGSVKDVAQRSLVAPATSSKGAAFKQLKFAYETNPLDGSCDQDLMLRSQPLLVTYHAEIINRLLVALRPPESVRLKQLTNAAMMKYEDIKKISTAGLHRAMQMRKRFKIDLEVLPTTLNIPAFGDISRAKSMLVMDFGVLTIKSEEFKNKNTLHIDELYKKSEDERCRILMNDGYDAMDVTLKSLKILFVEKDANGQFDLQKAEALLEPTGIGILIRTAIADDLNIPKNQIKGSLPDLTFNISERYLVQLLKLVSSIPKPPPDERNQPLQMWQENEPKYGNVRMQAPSEVTIDDDLTVSSEGKTTDGASGTSSLIDYNEQVDFQIIFLLNQIALDVYREEDKASKYFSLRVENVGMELRTRPLDMVLQCHVGTVEMLHHGYTAVDGTSPLYLIRKAPSSQHLLHLDYRQADRENPLFASNFHSTEQWIELKVQPLCINARQEALVDMQNFMHRLQDEIATLPAVPVPKITTASKYAPATPNIITTPKSKTPSQKGSKKSKKVDTVTFSMLKLRARVSGLRVVLATSNGPISEIAVEGLKVEMVQMVEKTKYFVRLESVAIDHFDSHSNYKRILSVVGDEMFRLECVQYNIPPENKRLDLLSQVEMRLTVRFSQLRFIFLYYWLSRLLNWISPFQNAAQRTASYAGSALQEGARTAVDLFQDQDITRIKLDIVINAPVIIVPANTQSSRALMVNFGQLIVKNEFRFCSALSVDGVSTLFDDINLKLDQMKICRVLLDKDCWTLTRERQLLKPITFVLAVQRNLSFVSVKSVPLISIRGQLPDIELGLTSDDYAVMMEILNENLVELEEPSLDLSITAGSSTTGTGGGSKEADAVKSSVLVDVELVESGEASNQRNGNVVAVAGDKTQQPPPYTSSSPPPPSTSSSSSIDSTVQVELGFEIDHLSAVLSKCVKREAVLKLDEDICPTEPLAGLQLRSIKLQARLFTNGCMSANAVVQGLEVEDQRAGDIGIRKLLDCMPGVQNSAVLTADYKTSIAAPRVALVNLNKFFLCLSVDFLLELSSFFTWAPTDRFAESLAERALAQSMSRAKRSAGEQISAGVQSPADLLQITTQINGIQVILVEDCRQPESTNAMFLEFRASMDIDSTADEMNMQGSVENLEMYSDQFAMHQRGMYKYPILSPCRMAVNYKKTANEESAKVIMPELKLRLSPAAIHHFSTTLAEVTRNKAEITVSTVEQIPADVWSEKLIASQAFWFLKEKDDIDYGCECDESMIVDDENSECSFKKTQRLVFDIPSVFMMLEADSGRRTIPMIYLHCGMEGEVYDWSSLLWVSSTVTCIAWYFNDRNNAWEPILEPIVEKMTPRPWKFRALVNQSDPLDKKDGQEEEQLCPKARMTVSISSDDVLELTAFSAAAQRRLEAKVDSSKPLEPYLLINKLGLPIMIGSTEHFDVPDDYISKPLMHGESVSLIGKMNVSCLGALELQDATPSMYLHVQIPELNVTRILDVSHAGLRLYHIQVRATADGKWKFLVDVSTSMGNRVIVLRSAVMVGLGGFALDMLYNFLPFDVEIYQKTDSSFRDVILLKADGGCASPTLSDVNQGNTEFCVKPIDDSYDVSIRGISWPVLEKDNHSVLMECCFGHSGVLYIQASAEHVSCLSESSNVLKQSHDVFNIHLQAPIVFLNLLHIEVQLSVEYVFFDLFMSARMLSRIIFQLIDCKSEKLRKSCILDLSTALNEVSVLSFRAFEDDPELNLGLMKAEDNSKCVLSLFSPIWLVNSTGLPLECKEAKSNCGRTCRLPVKSDIVPVMLNLSRKKFFEKKNARLKVCDSEWSSPFPLDTVGSAGRITCAHSKLKSYDVSVTSRLSEFGLTKICSFVPFYMVKNVSMFDIEVRQVDEDSWIRVNVNQCVGIWPNQNSRLIYCARYVGTVEESQHFLITDTAEMFATIANQHIGVYVSCNVSENSVIITLEKYQQGMIPLLIINSLQSYDLLYGQEASDKEPKVLKRGMCVYYAWESLLLKRSLTWTCGNAKDTWTMQSTFGEVFPDRDVACYYVSFSDGSQRVLLFTDDATVCTVARQVYDLEIADREFLISFQGVGLSLVNDTIGHEIAYVSLKRLVAFSSNNNFCFQLRFHVYLLFTCCSTGVIWEQKKKRFRAFSVKYCNLLETAYMKYLNDLRTKQRVDSCCQVHKLLVDFASMKILKPEEREIRRSFQSGFSLQYRVSPHDVQVHLKINSFQIDNQIPGCVFNTVFSRAPIPKSIASESVPKPFIEVTFIMRSANETIPYVQYFKILIQEMTLKADNGFLESLMSFYNASSVNKEDTDKEKFERDWNFVQQDLGAYALTASSDEQKAFYNLLHFSPLMLHLSYSQGGAAATEGETESIFQTHILGLLLKSIGVTMTEVQDVVFKLPYFERDCVFLGKQALFNEVYDHYFKQAVKQIYVLVLGLDVIGNPFGLMRDLSIGVEQLFYEPIQGAIEGPEEFAEGLALGMRSLLGHTVGGAAGAVSKITGTLGKGIAALTFDADYQQKRQRMMNRRTGDLSGVAQSGTGALLEMFDGVTGVFTKPIEGAREEGALGFAKGLGKGLIGAVTRPISGVVDFASTSFEALKKATEVLEEVKPTRPTRYIALDRIIRPYTFYEAEGTKMLMDLEKGKYRNTDSYVVHQPLTPKNDQFLMATDQRILHIMISDFTGSFTVTWSIPYTEMKDQPKMDGLKLAIHCKEKSSKWLSSKRNDVSGKSVFFLDESSLLVLLLRENERSVIVEQVGIINLSLSSADFISYKCEDEVHGDGIVADLKFLSYNVHQSRDVFESKRKQKRYFLLVSMQTQLAFFLVGTRQNRNYTRVFCVQIVRAIYIFDENVQLTIQKLI
ncbi:Vacuolar protein sorting-associated protein 13A [Trichinella murrelli]|uniref:Vacuolar protein sorting-associated protein 13A n=1 Tax=Trichinella murrelli TaxID=144512 RepID=A0A0V0UBN7_9BILA|nr:Vacuolar protein sorting-associated protein 13A [Trichinella murrelli]